MSTVVQDDPKLTEALAALEQRMVDKTPVEKVEMLKAFAKEHYGVQQEERAPILQFTDDQFERAMKDGIFGAKKVVTETTDAIQRKHNIPMGEAKAIAEEGLSTEMDRKMRRRDDCTEAAKVFRAIATSARGGGRPGKLEQAYEDERNYLKRTGREVRTNEMTTDYADSGYLAPQIWNTMLYENLARVSLLRRFGYWFPMESNVMKLPKLSVGLTGTTQAEAAGGNGSKPTIAQAEWDLKRLNVTTAPFSIELLENARPELIQLLTGLATIALNKKEDEICFNTSDSGWANLVNGATNLVTASGTDYTGVTFDDMTNLKYKLAEQYIPDDDIEGSGIIGGEAQYFVNQALIQNLLEIKGAVSGSTVGYLWQPVQQLAENLNIRGNRVRRVLSLPNTGAATTGVKVAVFGNLNYVWVGFKPGFIIDILREGIVKDTAGSDVNLATTSQYALRVNELLSAQVIDSNAFSILQLA